jgi:hypothetical protein
VAKYGKEVKKGLSFAFTLSLVRPGFAVPSEPPKISNSSTSITSSAKARPVSVSLPLKKVVIPVLATPKTSVAKRLVKSAAFIPNALVEYLGFKANSLSWKTFWNFAPIADGMVVLNSSLGAPGAIKTVFIAGLAIWSFRMYVPEKSGGFTTTGVVGTVGVVGVTVSSLLQLVNKLLKIKDDNAMILNLFVFISINFKKI